MGFYKEFLSLKKNPGPGPGESVFVKEYQKVNLRKLARDLSSPDPVDVFQWCVKRR